MASLDLSIVNVALAALERAFTHDTRASLSWVLTGLLDCLWLASRTADCQSESNVYQGGSIAPMQYAHCEVSEDQARSMMLRSYFNLLEQNTRNEPIWPYVDHRPRPPRLSGAANSH
jgi:hypothetical protein